MKKHFLVTVSFDSAHLTGVGFLCSFFQKLSEHQVTLLHICRMDSQSMNATLMETWENPEDKLNGKPTVGAKQALEKARAMLSKGSMSVDQIVTKTYAEQFGKVADILNEASKGLYDAIVLGKRASYTLQSFFERPGDETAKEIIRGKALTTPLWICPEPEEGLRNVLVCVDGSKNALRAVDHVGYILSKQPQHSITLFNAQSGTGRDADVIFKEAKAELYEHGISDDRIHTATSWGLSIPATIMSYAEKGSFAAIAFGLHGVKESLLKSINFAGGTAGKLIEKTNKISLWCCP
jgi:nucleotide-binding universal stress UspA family protein